MRLAVCGDAHENERVRGWIEQYCRTCRLPAEIVCILSPEELAGRARPGVFQAVFIGFGDSAGFLAARALRDRDRRCQIVLIDDTDRYAIQSLRIHAANFIVRPVQARHIVRSMELIRWNLAER